jgi:hypothetical protein
MSKPSQRRRIVVYGGMAALVAAAVPLALWASLTHTPDFYRTLVAMPQRDVEREAKAFVQQSLQLRNDIANEPTWEAVFNQNDVNAWLAEDLVKHFADQLPPEVHDPRIVFDADRVTLAFGLDQGPVRSVIWVVARPHVPEDNVVSLTLEKIRAGALPVPAERIILTLTEQARKNGLIVTWSRDGDLPVATIRYRADKARDDVVLERIRIREGQIKLSGRSNRATASALSLPRRQALQQTFPRRNVQVADPPAPEAEPAPVDVPAPAPPVDSQSTSGPVS